MANLREKKMLAGGGKHLYIVSPSLPEQSLKFDVKQNKRNIVAVRAQRIPNR